MRSRLFRWGERLLRSRWILPAAWIWRAAAWIRNCFYDWKIFKTYSVSIPVLSVGNIALGGTGKTPLVILLAQRFEQRRVAILARGYGDGDELRVIERNCPKAKIYAGADRVASARKAVEEGAELILLDDGLQHRRLHRDWDLVLLDPNVQFVREGNPKRANLIASFFPEVAPVTFCLKPKESLSSGDRIAIFCGIANPKRFEQMVVQQGVCIVGKLFLADHEQAKESQLRTLFAQTRPKYLLCTEKDWVKLPPTDLPIQCLRVEAFLQSGQAEWEAFLAKIEERLDNHRHHGRQVNNLLTKARREHSECDGGPVVQESGRSSRER